MTFWDFYKQHRHEIDGLLLDIDGTVVINSQPIGQAVKFIDALRHDNMPFYFLTNDGNHSIREKCGFLRSGGIHADESEIISCGNVLEMIVEESDWHDQKFFVLGELGKPDFAELAGLKVCRNLREIDECCGIIGAEGEYNWRPHMEAALNFFRHHPERPFIVPNPDSYWPSPVKNQLPHFGIGAGGQARFITGLLAEMGIEKQPLYLGKPYQPVYNYTLKKMRKDFNLELKDRSRILSIGDSLASDVRGANLSGMTGVLVLSGITDSRQAQAAKAEFKPHFIFDAMA